MSALVDYCMCRCKIHTIILKRTFVVAHKQHTVSGRQLPLDRKHLTLVQIPRPLGDPREDKKKRDKSRSTSSGSCEDSGKIISRGRLLLTPNSRWRGPSSLNYPPLLA